MGANEKHEAAMHGGEHDFGSPDPVSANRVRFMSESELDRFIAKIRAEAKAEALEEAIDALMAGPEANLNPDGTIRPPHLHRSPRLNHKPRLRVANWLLRRANQYKGQS